RPVDRLPPYHLRSGFGTLDLYNIHSPGPRIKSPLPALLFLISASESVDVWVQVSMA
ncbi:hypothetical protein CPB84DRAFT_1790533, partial [Gymnopilus junonius]